MRFEFPLILDGAMGTELIKRGYTGEISSEEWSLLHPEVIREIQSSYIDAGSRMIYTPTFGANRVKMEKYGLRDSVTDYNMRLAALSREVAGNGVYVAGDLAPSNLFIPSMAHDHFEEIYETYLEQASALERSGVDLFVIETISSVADARAALLAVRTVSTKPVMVSFTCNKKGRTITGADVTAACVTLQSMGADIFGLNCSYGPSDMVPQLRRLSDYADVPLLAKPNAGMPKTVDGNVVYDCPPDEFVRYIPEMIAAGVRVFGGCCGTDASHIRALSSVLKSAELPEKDRHDEIFLSVEREVFLLGKGAAPERFIPCGEDLRADASGFEKDVIMGIDLDDADISELEAVQWRFKNPVCFRSSEPAILEAALRVFQGRAAYTGPLSAEELDPLVRSYGLVVI